MPSLVTYRKVVTAQHTHELRLPDAPAGRRAAQELATLADGRTVVCLADGTSLPEGQPAQIVASIEKLPMPLPVPLRDEIRSASPQARLINQQVVDLIRERYSQSDEIKLLRIAPSPETAAWNDYVEECRQWGREQRSLLGL